MIADSCDLLSGVQVGVVGSWGFPRGRDRVGRRIVEQLVGAQATAHCLGVDAPGPAGVPRDCTSSTQLVSVNDYVQWLRQHSPQIVIFVEQDEHSEVLIAATRDEGIATVGALVWEKVFPGQVESYRCFDSVLAPHQAFEDVLHGMGIPAISFRWGWRSALPKPPLTDDEQIELLHVAGERGAWVRKGTERVAQAFLRLAAETDDFSLRLTTVDPLPEPLASQLRDGGVQVQEGFLPDARLQARVRGARATVQPSLWEGIGIPILESLAEGTPVVTTNGPPMNQYIGNKAEGILVPTQPGEHPELAVPLLEYSVDDLVSSLLLLRDRDLLRHLERKALAGGATRVDPERACLSLATGLRDLVAAGAGQA